MNMVYIVTLLSFIFVSHVFSQTDTFNVSRDSRGAYNEIGSVVAPTKMNVLYTWISNPIDIAVPGVLAKDVTASIIGSGSIKKISDGHFIVNVESVGMCLIAVKVKDKEVSRVEFRIKRIPDPIVTVGGRLLGGSVQPQVLQALTGIIPLLENFDFPARFDVKIFSMIYNSAGKSEVFVADGPMFTAEMKSVLSSIKTGDVIVFDNVMVVGSDSFSRKLRGITFTIL